MNLVITGHVDHGKSTIVGRLLADTGSLPEGKLEAVRAHCARHGRPFEYAFLLDALREERAQGITIDTARVFFKSSRRHYMLLDAPGHTEFLRNMVTGAARAEAALLVIDARDGVQENTRRHGYLLSLLGIRQIAVLVNKMDLVGRTRSAFERVTAEYQAFLASLALSPSCFVPVSGHAGDNIVTASKTIDWYHGPTVLEALDAFTSSPLPTDAPFRMPVQGVYKFAAGGDERRIVAGTITSGTVHIGDELVFLPSGNTSRIKTIEGFNRAPQSTAVAGDATGFTLTDDIFVSRGEVATRCGQRAIHVSTRLRASVFWLGRDALVPSRSYLMKLGSARVPVTVDRIHQVLDPSTLETTEGLRRIERCRVADCTLVAARPVAFDTADQLGELSRFVLVDNFQIAGGGIVRGIEKNAGRDACLARIERPTSAGEYPLGVAATATIPAVIWFTGLSGAGKTTIARMLEARLQVLGARVELLDGDELREVFVGTGFSPEERDAHVLRVGYLASRLECHGVSAICALISPSASARKKARALCKRFVEVHVATPIHECERRDVKGLYARARAGELTQFTGVDQPYEMPLTPEITVDTMAVSAAAAADAILQHLQSPAMAER